ncbi:MAG: hypothetical protein ACLPYS_11375 [Vulcanimicrobiaceae bacterium]
MVSVQLPAATDVTLNESLVTAVVVATPLQPVIVNVDPAPQSSACHV